jgi:hypothetical protein
MKHFDGIKRLHISLRFCGKEALARNDGGGLNVGSLLEFAPATEGLADGNHDSGHGSLSFILP